MPRKLNEAGFPIPDSGQEDRVVRECWASFKRTSGTEQVRSGRDFTEVKCRFLVRYTKTEITERMQVRYAGVCYDIQYVNDYEDDHRYVEIWCREVR